MINKKVILTLLFTLIVCFITGFFLFEPASEKLRDQMFAYKVHADRKHDLVVAGDSRIYRGISTDIIGKELNMISINLGFSSGAYSKPMFDLIDKKLNPLHGNVIILGISPLSVTDLAIDNGHIRRLNALKKEELIEYLYLNKLINIFAPTTPRFLWNSIFDQEANNENYLEEVNIKEGWVQSDYRIPNPLEALTSYKQTFSNTNISQKAIDSLYAQVRKWIGKGFLVYGFVPPSSANMEELERQYSDFNDNKIASGFMEAGGKWISFKETYTSFDGSHLDSQSAITLSKEIANAITNKTYLSTLADSGIIRANYYKFNSKYTFQNNFENDTINILETNIAHSGTQVLFCGQNLEYLSFFNTNMKNVIDNKINTVLVEVYVYYESEQTSVRLIFDLKQNNNTTAWKGLELSNIVKPGKWGKVKLEFNIPENIKASDKLMIYTHNLNKTEILFDDFKLDMY